MASLRIPTPLRPYTDGQVEIQVRGNTIAEALDDLVKQHPELNKHLFSEMGELRPFVRLFLGEEDVHHLEGVETSLKEDDTLKIIPSIAGGRESKL